MFRENKQDIQAWEWEATEVKQTTFDFPTDLLHNLDTFRYVVKSDQERRNDGSLLREAHEDRRDPKSAETPKHQQYR